MEANKFIKEFGWDKAKEVAEYRDNHAKGTHVFKFNKSCADKGELSGGAYLYTENYGDWSVSVDDLKRLVESYEFVESLGGLKVSLYLRNHNMLRKEHLLKAKQAIADVESCQ